MPPKVSAFPVSAEYGRSAIADKAKNRAEVLPLEQVRTKTPTLPAQIAQLQQRLGMSEGELLSLALETSPGDRCGLRSLADLNDGQQRQLHDLLKAILRTQQPTEVA